MDPCSIGLEPPALTVSLRSVKVGAGLQGKKVGPGSRASLPGAGGQVAVHALGCSVCLLEPIEISTPLHPSQPATHPYF